MTAGIPSSTESKALLGIDSRERSAPLDSSTRAKVQAIIASLLAVTSVGVCVGGYKIVEISSNSEIGLAIGIVMVEVGFIGALASTWAATRRCIGEERCL